MLSMLTLLGCAVHAESPGDARIVAVREIAPGAAISPSDIALRPVPASIAPQGPTFASAAEVVGRVANARILADEVVRAERLADPLAGVGIGALLAPPRRAVTLTFTQTEGWTPLLRVGDRVDVLWTERTPEPAVATFATSVVVSGARVLALGANAWKKSDSSLPYERGDDRPQHGSGDVTLELGHDGVQELAEARSTGTIHLAIRSDIDTLVLPRAPALVLADLAAP